MRLTITPPYLDPNSHEAVYEIDLTVFEIGEQAKSQLGVPGEIVLAAAARKSDSEPEAARGLGRIVTRCKKILFA